MLLSILAPYFCFQKHEDTALSSLLNAYEIAAK